jgi:ribosomal protein S18 acetylase RimI-like enzyme
MGVREAYRGRGIGKALLLASFRMFEERGSKRVSLGVDAGNATGATELYEKAGMRVEQRHELYQRPVSGEAKISSDPVNRLGRKG